MCRSMVDIQSVAAEIRRGKKKIDDRRYKSQGKNIMAPLLHRAAITNSRCPTWHIAAGGTSFIGLLVVRQRSGDRCLTVLQTVVNVRRLPLCILPIILNLHTTCTHTHTGLWSISTSTQVCWLPYVSFSTCFKLDGTETVHITLLRRTLASSR